MDFAIPPNEAGMSVSGSGRQTYIINARLYYAHRYDPQMTRTDAGSYANHLLGNLFNAKVGELGTIQDDFIG